MTCPGLRLKDAQEVGSYPVMCVLIVINITIDADVKVAISVVVTFLLTVILYTSLLLLGYCILKARRTNSPKEKYVCYTQFKGTK